MSDDKVDALLEGGIGYFWFNKRTIKSSSREVERGFVRRTGSGQIEVTGLDEREFPWGDHEVEFPKSITGITEHGGVLILDVRRARPSMAIGGARASVHRFFAQVMIAGPHPASLRSGRVSSLTLHYPSIHRWIEAKSINEKGTRSADGLVESYTAELKSPPEIMTGIGPGMELAIQPHWKVSGTATRRMLSASTAITCRSSKPRTIDDLREVLHWCHALLCVALQGRPVADSGRASPDFKSNEAVSHYWDSHFMVAPTSAPSILDEDWPLFTLDTLGGMSAIHRWVRLCRKHPRAVQPIFEPYAVGFRSPAVRMLEVAAAIEYWVACHRRSTGWAKSSGKWRSASKPSRKSKEPYASLLAHHVGGHFEEWVGDTNRWADHSWDTYNSLKHDPDAKFDLGDTGVLAESGSLRLTAALLDRIARSKAPSRLIFANGRHTWQLRGRIRQAIQ